MSSTGPPQPPSTDRPCGRSKHPPPREPRHMDRLAYASTTMLAQRARGRPLTAATHEPAAMIPRTIRSATRRLPAPSQDRPRTCAAPAGGRLFQPTLPPLLTTRAAGASKNRRRHIAPATLSPEAATRARRSETVPAARSLAPLASSSYWRVLGSSSVPGRADRCYRSPSSRAGPPVGTGSVTNAAQRSISTRRCSNRSLRA